MKIGVSYKVITRTFGGTLATSKTGESFNITTLSYFKEVNNQGVGKIVVPANDPIAAQFTKNAVVEIWRAIYHPNPSLRQDWYPDFISVLRKIRYFQSAEGQDYVEATCYSMLHLLSWRVVSWKSVDGIANNRTTFLGQYAEFILKTLVDYNIGPDGTVGSGRINNGTNSSISIAPIGSEGGGTTMSYDCAYQSLLTVCQDICKVGGGDIDMTQQSDGTYKFHFYLTQLGTNRTANSGNVTASRVIFSTGLGNISEPDYSIDYDAEKTVAIVGGLGTCQQRTVSVVTGNGFVAGTNQYEVFVDARQSNDSPTDVGNIELYNNKARYQFNFKVQQIPTCRYGLTYFLGDLCIGQYKAFSTTIKIQRVNVSFTGKEGENIDVILRSL